MNSSSLSSLVDVTRRAGLLDPRRLPALTAAIGRWGPTLAAPYAASALATPNRIAVVDDRGSISCGELDRNSTQLANGLRQLGLDRGERLGIACRNHREFVEATIAAAKLGVSVVYLNTGFAAPQLRDVLAREQVDVLVVDAELVELADRESFRAPVVVVGSSAACAVHAGTTSLQAVRSSGARRLPLRPSKPLAPVLLTSGTTGTPKGAQRSVRADPAAAAIVEERLRKRNDINTLNAAVAAAAEVSAAAKHAAEQHLTAPPVARFLLDWYDPEVCGNVLQPGTHACSHPLCGRVETRRHEFRRCSCCGRVRYCSRSCQSLDWRLQHKFACLPLLELYGWIESDTESHDTTNQAFGDEAELALASGASSNDLTADLPVEAEAAR